MERITQPEQTAKLASAIHRFAKPTLPSVEAACVSCAHVASRLPKYFTASLGQAYSLLGFRIVDGVVGAGFPQKPSHSAVFAQIDPAGSRLSELARGAKMSPQAMGELVDELESLGYLIRQPDPCDRRAKLIVLTRKGKACVEAGRATIETSRTRSPSDSGSGDITSSDECSRSYSTPSRTTVRHLYSHSEG